MYLTHGIFLTCTYNSHFYVQVTYLNIYQCTINFQRKKNPCFNKVNHISYLESQLFARCDESPSTLVSGLVTTAPPLGFYPFHPFLTPQFTLHYLHRRYQQSRPSSFGTLQFNEYLNKKSKHYTMLTDFVKLGCFNNSLRFCPEYTVGFPKSSGFSPQVGEQNTGSFGLSGTFTEILNIYIT
jgi:hypothetical protein